jgi:FMN phosphatase YigB (HAD superfamily)
VTSSTASTAQPSPASRQTNQSQKISSVDSTEVYSAIDYSGLLQGDVGGDTSGYRDSSSLRNLLLRRGARLAIASNSPSWHVKRVLAALGLSNIQWCVVITSDVAEGLTKADALFWSTLLETYQTHPHGVTYYSKGNHTNDQTLT